MSVDSSRSHRAALSVTEAATAAGISRSFLYEAIAAGRLVSLKIGNRRLVRPTDLESWLSNHVSS